MQPWPLLRIMRSRSTHFGSSARKRNTSSYSTRMISISDIDEPTWPRSPPSRQRTTSLRRYLERSSSGGVAGLSHCTASVAFAIKLILHFSRQRRQEVLRPRELRRLRLCPAFGGTRQKPP